MAACATTSGNRAAASTPSPARSPSTAPTARQSPSANTPHVFVIVLENRSYSEVLGMSYVAELASKYGLATNYHGVAHPSLPNYLALTSGSTWGIADDGYHRLPAGGLGSQLTAAGIDWRAYMEGMNNGCFNSGYPYALKHNPFAFYGGSCPREVVSFTHFSSDMSGTVPNFVWITPDLCHDGHDCSSRQADDFLAGLVPTILASAAWRDGGVLLLTWDEDDGGSGNRVPAIVVAPGMTRHVTARAYDHYSLLATVEDRLGVPRLGGSRQADPLSDVLP